MPRREQAAVEEPAVKTLGIISQELLQELREVRKARDKADKLGKTVLQALQDGLPIEDGPLTAMIKHRSDQRFTANNIEPVLGAEAVQRLRDEVPKTKVEWAQVSDVMQE